jgi:NAD(P)H-dependent flavin oxidoreductase YrpB (nitropropane dioxygenase family)
VSNAGGLGILAVSWSEPGALRQQLRKTKSLTDRPFGVNLVLQQPLEDRLAICLEEGVSLISFSWGDPTPFIKTVHEAGAMVMHTVGQAAEAKRAVEAGADIILAQGWEAGGHVWGQVATLPLVPRIVETAHTVPVVAAGGIGDARGIVAVLALGAAGAALGTRFLATDEAAIHPLYKEAILRASEVDTLYSSLFDIGWRNAPHRTLKNSTTELWERSGCAVSGQRPNEGEKIAFFEDGSPVVRYSDVIPVPGMKGNVEALALYAGQSAGMVARIQPAGEIVQELVEEACQILASLANLTNQN